MRFIKTIPTKQFPTLRGSGKHMQQQEVTGAAITNVPTVAALAEGRRGEASGGEGNAGSGGVPRTDGGRVLRLASTRCSL